jgi:hypothetical protein
MSPGGCVAKWIRALRGMMSRVVCVVRPELSVARKWMR